MKKFNFFKKKRESFKSPVFDGTESPKTPAAKPLSQVSALTVDPTPVVPENSTLNRNLERQHLDDLLFSSSRHHVYRQSQVIDNQPKVYTEDLQETSSEKNSNHSTKSSVDRVADNPKRIDSLDYELQRQKSLYSTESLRPNVDAPICKSPSLYSNFSSKSDRPKSLISGYQQTQPDSSTFVSYNDKRDSKIAMHPNRRSSASTPTESIATPQNIGNKLRESSLAIHANRGRCASPPPSLTSQSALSIDYMHNALPAEDQPQDYWPPQRQV